MLALLLVAAGCGGGRDLPPDVVFLMIDALRRDHVGTYGYERDTTPQMDSLAREGLLFEDAVAQASWTFPSLASLFTSRYAAEIAELRGDREPSRGLPDASVTLAEALSDAGYRTVAVSSSPYTTEPFTLLVGFGRTLQRFVAPADVLGDDSMKFRLSSSGCETRPARGEPARAGSEPCDGLGNGIGEA